MNSNRTNLRRTLTASLALVIISGSGLAAAGPEHKDRKNKDLLRGPKVTHTQPSDKVNDSMQNTEQRKARRDRQDRQGQQGRQGHSFREFQMALRMLESDRTDQSLGLSKTQQEQLKAIAQEHRQAMKVFQDENQEKIQRMRERLSGTDKQSKKTARERSRIESTDQSEQHDKQAQRKRRQNQRTNNNQSDRSAQIRERLHNLMESAPANREAFAKANKVLTAEQREMIKSHIHTARQRHAKQGDRQPNARRQRDNDRQTDRPTDRQTDRQTDRPNDRQRTKRRQLKREQVNRAKDRTTTENKPKQKGKPSPKVDD